MANRTAAPLPTARAFRGSAKFLGEASMAARQEAALTMMWRPLSGVLPAFVHSRQLQTFPNREILVPIPQESPRFYAKKKGRGLPSAQQRLHRTRSYMASVLTPRAPIVDWLTQLDATLKHDIGPLTGHPVVLDLSAVRLSPNAIMHLISNLEERKVRILGIEGIEPTESHAELPPVLRRSNVRTAKLPKPANPAPQKQLPTSLLIDNPVRSGERVFTEGDVTVIGSVGSGAEIVAAGSVHIYGTLRGRAMAGAWGNTRARIFCQRVEAELLAIGAYFKTADEIEESLRYRPAQVWLEGTTLRISVMG